MTQLLKNSQKISKRFIQFLGKCPSPYHVVDQCKKILNNNGFVELKQTQSWNIQSGKKYFYSRNGATIIAFKIGQKFNCKQGAFKIIGAHTDSPVLKLAPHSKINDSSLGSHQVVTYGGGLWGTWLDRDLGLAGRIVYKNKQQLSTKIWASNRPLMRIPHLAIHLRDQRNKDSINKDSQLRPISSSQLHKKEMMQKQEQIKCEIQYKYGKQLVTLISKDLDIKPQQLKQCQLSFYDSQQPTLLGFQQDFISGARLDNLMSSFCAIDAITSTQNKGKYIDVALLFDHQQIGSSSMQGADSCFLPQFLSRSWKTLSKGANDDSFQQAIRRSMIVSADMAHGIHPNYSEKHQSNHKIQINKGVVFKINLNMRYATDGFTISIFKQICGSQVPLQQFIVRNQSPCGSTIGPIVSSKTGIRTIDIGICQFAMHSVREICGVLDVWHYYKFMALFFQKYENIKHIE